MKEHEQYEEIRESYDYFKKCLLPPERFDYTTLRFIGKGSYGRVYSCQKFNSNEIISLKIILGKEDEYIQLQDEISNMYQLQHENCVRIIDFKILKRNFQPNHENLYEIVIQQEFAEFSSLDQELQKNYAIVAEEFKSFMMDCANGLNYIHSKSFLHGDIKPSNILIFAGNQRRRFKIADVGGSITLKEKKLKNQEASEQVDLYLVSKLQYTKVYCAPEFMKAIKNQENKFSTQSDIFSLGLTFLRALGVSQGYNCFCDYYYLIEQLKLINEKLSIIVKSEITKEDITLIAQLKKNYKKKINEILDNYIKSYDQQIKDIIKQMLAYEKKKRINLWQIISELSLKQISHGFSPNIKCSHSKSEQEVDNPEKTVINLNLQGIDQIDSQSIQINHSQSVQFNRKVSSKNSHIALINFHCHPLTLVEPNDDEWYCQSLWYSQHQVCFREHQNGKPMKRKHAKYICEHKNCQGFVICDLCAKFYEIQVRTEEVIVDCHEHPLQLRLFDPYFKWSCSALSNNCQCFSNQNQKKEFHDYPAYSCSEKTCDFILCFRCAIMHQIRCKTIIFYQFLYFSETSINDILTLA